MLPRPLHAHPVVADSTVPDVPDVPGMPFAHPFRRSRSKESLPHDDNSPAPYPADIRLSRSQQQLHSIMREPSPLPVAHFDPPASQDVQALIHSDPESDDSGKPHDSQRGSSSVDTAATSIHTLHALQTKGLPNPADRLEPLAEDDGSYDLVAPQDAVGVSQHSLETRSEYIFSHDHLRAIFRDPTHLSKFTSFLGQHRTSSVPTLMYYLDTLKAIKAIAYANSIAAALPSLDNLDWSRDPPPPAQSELLEGKAGLAFDRLVAEDLPAFVAHCWTNVVSTSIQRRITGTLPPHLREASEGLAEVFCLTDPSREDNPIVFASEEFHRTTQYGMSYVIGRNCRFLQGPKTNPTSVRRLREACLAGKELCEVLLNYRRDGSPFMNLLMVAPLRDSRGQLRYFIGAQVDVSGLAREAADLDALQVLLADEADAPGNRAPAEHKEPIRELSEIFNAAELDTIRKAGGSLLHERAHDDEDANSAWQRPRLLIKDNTPPLQTSLPSDQMDMAGRNLHGKLSGVYSHYLLVRPHPSLRILFTSPSLRVPGILQSPFMDRIGSSERVRDELVSALAEGRGVTAKIRWVTRAGGDGRPRWVHCTPLLGHNGAVGVWMVVLVDDDDGNGSTRPRNYRNAPAVPLQIRRRDDVNDDGAFGARDGAARLRAQRSLQGLVEQRAASSSAAAGSRGNGIGLGGYGDGAFEREYRVASSAGSTVSLGGGGSASSRRASLTGLRPASASASSSASAAASPQQQVRIRDDSLFGRR